MGIARFEPVEDLAVRGTFAAIWRRWSWKGLDWRTFRRMAHLHPSILAFFEQKMSAHSEVERCTRLQADDEYVYELVRKNGKSRVIVFLSDAYDYGLADYLSRPPVLRPNSFILIARPEAQFDPELVARAKKDKIAIGKIGKMMGAINFNNIFEYKTVEEKKQEKKRQ